MKAGDIIAQAMLPRARRTLTQPTKCLSLQRRAGPAHLNRPCLWIIQQRASGLMANPQPRDAEDHRERAERGHQQHAASPTRGRASTGVREIGGDAAGLQDVDEDRVIVDLAGSARSRVRRGEGHR